MNHVSTNIRKWAFKWYSLKMKKVHPDMKIPALRKMFESADNSETDVRSCRLKDTIASFNVDIFPDDDDVDSTSFREWWRYFPLMWKFQKYFTKHGEKNFTMAPLTNYGIRHIRLDTDALYGLCLKANLFTRRNVPLPVFRSNAVVHWKAFFPDISETANKSFALGLCTDGVACSYYYQKRYVQQPPRAHNSYGFDKEGNYGTLGEEPESIKVVGVDPGRIDIFTAVDQDENVVKMSRKEYYSLTGMTKNQKTRNRWMKNNTDITSIITHCPTAKTSNIEDLRSHCDHVKRHLLSLVDFYGARRFTRQKFKTYIGRQKIWETIIKRITKNDPNTIVALGDAKFGHNSKGGPSTPLQRLRRELKRRSQLRLVDEYRTSITCSHCDGDLPKKTRFWQVKVCNDLCLTHWNRDVNAARNIRNIFIYMNTHNGERPTCFTRTPV
jgi:hypothetical protein